MILNMSNLSVRTASEAAIGIAILRHFATTPNSSPTIDRMASEILGTHSDAHTIRSTISALAMRESQWIKERATHATISARVNERRGRELSSIASVSAAALSTLRLSSSLRNDNPAGINELQESYVQAMQGIDQFPMGMHAKQALRSQLRGEVALAVPEALRPQVNGLLIQAETTYLNRCAESVYANYVEPDDGNAPSI